MITKLARWAVLTVLAVSAVSCRNTTELSVGKAKEHAQMLAKISEGDVAEVRSGMPQGEVYLHPMFKETAAPRDNLEEVRAGLERARNRVQDLRVAKSTFFAYVDTNGTVLRNDQDQDLMAGKNAFAAFPDIKQALAGKYVETRGSMPEAAGVRGRSDGQWVAAQPVSVDGQVKGILLTGWSWSAYAYRLETSVRSKLKIDSASEQEKLPLVYVYVLVDKAAYGAPVSPEINAESIQKLDPLSKLGADGTYAAPIEITDRSFGLGVKIAPALGPRVAIAVLRSET
jgi:hypothetical protein